MKDVQYLFFKIASKLLRNPEIKNDFFRRQVFKIMGGVNIVGNICTPEPHLVSIGNNVTIADSVLFLTHDNSIMKVDANCYNLFGYITIGDNCFIGQRSIIMYGVTLADNVIVAAGSVVTKSFNEERIIIGGNPARKIGTWDAFFEHRGHMAMSKHQYKEYMSLHPEMFVRK